MGKNKVVRNYINGQWVDAENSGFLDVENPSTGEVLAQVPLSTIAETDRAVDRSVQSVEVNRLHGMPLGPVVARDNA